MTSDDVGEEGIWDDSWRIPTKAVPSIIYYYCSVDTFIKIITSKTLWLTNIFFMNDSQEFIWLTNKARQFAERQGQRHPSEHGYQYLEILLQQELRHDIYCACFSEQPDLLSQWRAYADDGKGFAIGFSAEQLRAMCTRLRGNLANIIYDDEQQEALVKKLFDLPPRLCDGEDPTIGEGSGTILSRIVEAASRCKSKAFSEEMEWRLIFDATSGVGPGFMDRRGTITPYIEIPWVDEEKYRKRGTEPIREIYFGPTNKSKEQRYAVELLLSKGGFKRVRLVPSSVSYR